MSTPQIKGVQEDKSPPTGGSKANLRLRLEEDLRNNGINSFNLCEM